MTTIQMHPPQTYSRLFRPWDSKNSQEQSDLLLKQKHSESLRETNLNNIEKQVLCEPVPFTITDPVMPYYPVIDNNMVNDIYLTNPMTMPTFGLDPVGINLMEQEYARVMAEDAQIKAMNARKQRPKKFKCPHCNVAFSNNGQLKGHIRIHTGERPFKCDVESCGKTFTRNEELTRHKRIHTGLRPFGCTICGKKFGRRDHLKKHTKTHMPQDRHLGAAMFVPIFPYLYGY